MDDFFDKPSGDELENRLAAFETPARRFGSVKADLDVRPLAERFSVVRQVYASSREAARLVCNWGETGKRKDKLPRADVAECSKGRRGVHDDVLGGDGARPASAPAACS
jgi:hypothetical protein